MNQNQTIRTLIQSYLDRFVAKDLDAIRAMMEDDVHLFDPFVRDVHGLAAVLDVYRAIFADCATLAVRNVRIIVDTNELVAALQLEVICGEVTIPVVDIVTFSESGRIQQLTAYLDRTALSS